MKYLIITFIAMLSWGCGSGDGCEATPGELEAAAEAGRQAGQHATSLPENSMAQQEAVLDIRARETMLREGGYPSCADTFAVEAAKELGIEH